MEDGDQEHRLSAAGRPEADLVFAGLLTVIIIGLVVENLVFRWLERRTVLRWGMTTGH